MLIGGKYKFVSKKGEGTFSEVIKAQTSNNKFVAIKRMKNHFDSIDQVNNLREVQALKKLSPHPGIIKLLEVVFERSTGRLSLVFELMEMNIYELIRGRRHYLAEKKVKLYMYQLLKAMDHMHRNGIFHRDIKPENILLNEDKLKVADFGSCRGVKSKQPFTEYISTRWYRAPECLLTDGYYNYKMDMWGVGCVFFEVLSLFPLFPGTNELDQIQKIHNIVGTPPPELLAKLKRSVHMNFNFPPKEGTGIDRLIPNAPPECVELIKKLLAYNPDDRLSARQALRHPYFRDLREGEKRLKHGAPLYSTIKSNPESQPDEAAKKQIDTDKPKASTLSQLPQLKPAYPHNQITTITNIITTNITTTNILGANGANPILHPPAAGAPLVAPPATQPAPGLTGHVTSGISNFGASFAQGSTGPAGFGGSRVHPNSRSISDLPSLHKAAGGPPAGAAGLTGLTGFNPNAIPAGNAGAPPPPFGHNTAAHVSASDLLHYKKEVTKKPLPAQLPTLRPKDSLELPRSKVSDSMEFTRTSLTKQDLDQLKDASPSPLLANNPLVSPPLNPIPQAITTTTTTTTTTTSASLLSSTSLLPPPSLHAVPPASLHAPPLPSIKGTGWKK